MFRPVATGTALSVAALAFAAPSQAAVRVYAPVAQAGHVVVFRVAGTGPGFVRSAYLRTGKRRTAVSASKVRRAATGRRLRVTLPGWMGQRRAAKAAAAPKLVVVTTCTTSNTSYRRLVRGTSGLISFWRLDETSGTGTCETQGRNPGAYVGRVTRGLAGATHDKDRAVALNGRSGAVRIASTASLSPRAAFSAEAWIKPRTTSGSKTILRKDGQYLLRLADGALHFRVWAGGRAQEVTSDPVVKSGRWQHVAATYDGAAIRVYLGGDQLVSQDASGRLATTKSPLYLGASSSGGIYDRFDGGLDDVAVYGTALSASAITAHDGGAAAGASGGDDGATTTTKTGTTPKRTISSIGGGAGTGPTAACPNAPSWTDGLGGFGGASTPGACWRAYGDNSVFNTPISSGASTWSGSGTVVNWLDNQGSGPIDWPLGTYDGYQAATYYGTASDPVYTLVHDPSTSSYGTSNIDGLRIHAPVGMRFHRDNDSLMSIVDQTTNTEYDFWYVTAIDDSAHTITYKWGGQLPVDGSGIMNQHGYAFESGFGAQFGYIREAELMSGQINHALYFCVPGANGRVAPAVDTGDNFADQQGMPPMGGRIQVTLTDSQIDAITLDGRPAPWYYKVILRAAAHYGMFVSDEGDSPWGGLRTESGVSYEAAGQENPWKRFAREQGMGSDPTLRFKDLRDASGQSVWRSIRVVAPSSYGYSDALQ
jgi:hypothetical protein